MDLKKIREESIRTAKQIGVEISPLLPLMDTGFFLRNSDEVISRLLAMHAVAAVAYGLGREKSIEWLENEKLKDSLTYKENRFIFYTEGEPDRFMKQIEAIWALCWSVNIVENLDFSKKCDATLVRKLPNLNKKQSSEEFRRLANFRPLNQIVQALDLSYCLHWSINQSDIDGNESPLEGSAFMLVERRRALEWILSDEDWENVFLDT